MQCAGWIQSWHRSLGSAGVDEGGRHRSDPRTSQGETPGSEAANHLRQRTAVHRSGLQGVYSHLGHDARPNLALLSTVERKAGTPLSLEDAKRLIQEYADHYNEVRLHSAIRVCDAERHTHRSAGRDPRGARPEAGKGSPAAPTATPPGGLRRCRSPR